MSELKPIYITNTSTSYNNKMNKHQELEMWYALHWQLRSVPNEHRTINHSHYKSEIETRIYTLVDELNLNQQDWKTE